MKDLHLIDKSLAQPLIRFLKNNNAPVADLLNQAQLPMSAIESNSGSLPTYAVWDLFHLAANFLAMGDIGFKLDEIEGDQVVGPIYQAVKQDALNVHEALHQLIVLVRSLSTHANISLQYQSNGVWLFGGQREIDNPGLHYIEQFTIALWVRFMRKFIDNNWQPLAIMLQTNNSKAVLNQLFEQSLISENQNKTGIFISNEHLAIKNIDARPREQIDSRAELATGLFSEKLTHILTAYYKEGFPTLKQTVSLVGLSLRQIQRRLAKENTSFKEVLENVRREQAIEYLRNGELKINQIAEYLGYSVHTHFTRAFVKWFNVTPSQYRETHLSKNIDGNKKEPNI